MADPSRQSNTPPRPGWVRLCQWLWKQHGFVWGTVIFGVALNLFASWLITPSGAMLSNTPLGVILGYPLLLALGGGVLLGLTGGLWLVNRRYPASPSQQVSTHPLTQQDRPNVRVHLREEYQEQWRESLPLQGAALMALGLHERKDVTRSSAQLVFTRTYIESEHPLPSGTSIIQEYDRAKQGGLLILGKAGAGKTTLLLDLAFELLARAEGPSDKEEGKHESDTIHPIPVILNLSSWANKKLRLSSWLIDQLRVAYQIPTYQSQALLNQNQGSCCSTVLMRSSPLHAVSVLKLSTPIERNKVLLWWYVRAVMST